MLIDAEEAKWLTGLFAQAIASLEHSPGLTIEVVDDSTKWLQVIPEISETEHRVDSFLLNFPCKELTINPIEQLQKQDVQLPPGTSLTEWSEGEFSRIQLRADIPLIALVYFCGDILENLVFTPEDAELAVQIEYGY